MVISASARVVIFGQPGQVKRSQVMTPWGIAVWCHDLLAERFAAACADAAACAWNPQRIDSYNPRPIRGYDGDKPSEWSLHAWALAWDFFATPPGVSPPGGVWTPDDGVPPEFAACFERHGFRWGGRWPTRTDVPHIEWADGQPPPLTVSPAVVPTVVEEDDMPQPQLVFHPDVPGEVWLVGADRIWKRKIQVGDEALAVLVQTYGAIQSFPDSGAGRELFATYKDADAVGDGGSVDVKAAVKAALREGTA